MEVDPSKSGISVIIPTLEEEREIGSCLQSLRIQSKFPPREVIVVDGGSTDQTRAFARAAGARVFRCEPPGRARQFNMGAKEAVGDIYFFLHADARPPEGYARLIRSALAKEFDFGCFAYRFDHSSLLMKLNSYLTKYDGLLAGGGDQGLFVRSDLFKQLGGYDEDHLLMEDFDLYRRLKKAARGTICSRRLTVSARKYRKNGYFRVQLANLLVFGLYHLGIQQSILASTYKRLLR